MKVLVTGSEGFIGRYIVNELLNSGYEVVGLDNLSKYGVQAESQNSHKNYRLVIGDATDLGLLKEIMFNVDYVIAGAAMIGGISYFHSFAYDLLAQNERITAATCDAAIYCWKSGGALKRIIYLSSSMVFEGAITWPSYEGDELKSPPPISSYGFQKLAVEYFARAAYDQYGLPYTICRPFNCVGVGENRSIKSKNITSGELTLSMSHVVPDLIQKILKGQNPVHILGDGSQIRHYTYGKDLAKGIRMAMEDQRAINEDFNLSSEFGHTVLEVAEIIWKKVKPAQKFNYVSDSPFKYDVQKRIPSTKKAKEILGFTAETSLEDVIDVIIDWVKIAIKEGKI